MGTCLGTCCGSCCASCACNACAKCCPGFDGKKNNRVPYMIIMFFGVVFALVLRYWASDWVVDLYLFKYQACGDTCHGVNAAYRVSFTLFLLFIVIALALFSKKGWHLHTSYFWGKIIMLCIVLVICFLIPNNFFDVYAIIARFVSGIFLVLQIIILIDFGYRWKEAWIDEKDWKVPFLVACLLMYAGSIVIWAFSFGWFGGEACRLQTFFIAFTICLTVIFSVISVTEWCGVGNLLTSAVVTLYCTYLCWSSLQSDPTSCNTLSNGSTPNVVIGIFIAAATVTYAGWNLSTSRAWLENEDAEDKKDENAFIATGASASQHEKIESQPAAKSKSSSEDDEKEVDLDTPEMDEKRAKARKFHFVMAIASMYLAMVITNWGSETGSSGESFDLGTETFWIKIVSQWVTVLLYTWTLVAHKVLSGRDFS